MRTNLFLLQLTLLCLFSCAPKAQEKPHFLWIDAAANFRSYANDADSISRDCARIAQMGITDIVVDVRPTSGHVLFRSTVAPELKRTADFDYLKAFIESGHKAGLRVHAGVNMMVYDRREDPEWCAVDLLPDRSLVNQARNPEVRITCFLDPANPQVQDFLLRMLGELASYEGLDGIVMDRCRYDDYALDAGYTEAGYKAFSEFLGHEPERWPVFTDPGHIFLDKEPDALEVQWLTFRCQVIHDFVARCAETVHAKRADLPLGIYVGAWFSEYYRSGVNWTSPSYPIAQEESTYRWATPAYQATGLAPLVDFMLLGTYCASDNLYGSDEKTIQGFARLGRKRLCGDVPFYAGPDLGNEPGFRDGNKGPLLPEILRVLDTEADGSFFFDLCHIRAFNYFPYLCKGNEPVNTDKQ